MKIDLNTVKKISHLARLEFNEEGAEKIQKDMTQILDWVEQLNEVDTTGIEPITTMSSEVNVMREDVVGEHLLHEAGLPRSRVQRIGLEAHVAGDGEAGCGVESARQQDDGAGRGVHVGDLHQRGAFGAQTAGRGGMRQGRDQRLNRRLVQPTCRATTALQEGRRLNLQQSQRAAEGTQQPGQRRAKDREDGAGHADGEVGDLVGDNLRRVPGQQEQLPVGGAPKRRTSRRPQQFEDRSNEE